MKKFILILLIAVAAVGCEKSEDPTEFYFENVAVKSVELPQAMLTGQAYEVKVLFDIPTECHSFAGFDYQNEGNTRKVAVVHRVISNSGPCQVLQDVELERNFFFTAQQPGEIIFQFWSGRDEGGNDNFISHTIMVE